VRRWRRIVNLMLTSRPLRFACLSVPFVLLAVAVPLLAASTQPKTQPNAQPKTNPALDAMARAASTFLANLDYEQSKLGALTFEDASRTEWHFVPKERPGLPLKKMNEAQRKAAHALVKTALSAPGHKKLTTIIGLEAVLAELEKNPVRRDPENYYVSIFGSPGASATWGWKIEGHHVSLNFTVVGGTLVATSPTFLGANPAEVRQGPQKGTRALGAEEDLGRTLLESLSPAQKARALFEATAPPDIITVASSKVDPLAVAGISVAEMGPASRQVLGTLLETYTSLMTPALAAERMAKVKAAGIDKIHFAWAGGTEKGDPHYYRVQGPTFLIEYDNTQNDANHVHTVWRDFHGDFGRDLLRDHLRGAHATPLAK
jgi:hypothetical protein